MGLADAAWPPQVQVVAGWIEALGAFKTELVGRHYLVAFESELSVGFFAAQKLHQVTAPQACAFFLFALALGGRLASQTPAGDELAPPNCGASEGFSVQENRRNPLPRKGAVAALTFVNFEKGCHIFRE